MNLLSITLTKNTPGQTQVYSIRIDAKSGLRAGPGADKVILEAFKPGTAPPDSNSIIGYGDQDGQPVSDASGRGGGGFFNLPTIRSGTGGLY